MQFDRKITISAGSSRRAMVWQAQTLLISELWAKLQTLNYVLDALGG